MTKQNEKDAKRVPELRFKGFADAWEQRKLGDVTDIKTGSRNHQDSVENGKYPFFVRSEKIERLDEYDFDTKAILIPGDGRIGEIFHYYDGKFALHQRVYKVDNFNGIDALFLLSLFRYSFRRHALRLNAQGTVPSLRLPMFTKWEILLPKLEEQEKIGQLFQSLDKTITLHEEKHRQLERLKKALLQKMFADETGYPVLRFKCFTEKWEQVELNDIAPVTMGQSPNSKNYTENPNNYILVQGNADLFNGQVLPRIYTTQVTKVAHAGDILMSVRAPVGNIAQTQYDVVIGRGIAAISGNLFIKQLLNKMDKAGYWNKYIAGSTFESVNSNDIKSANIKVPKLEEQEKIGQLFQSLDKTITLHDKKIQYLKQLKRGLLQKMFV